MKTNRKQSIKNYVSELDLDARSKRELYTILNGGIYSSLDRDYKKNNSTKGTKTFYLDDGTKQRVDTYDGRLKAARYILGEDYNQEKIYSLLRNSNKKYASSANPTIATKVIVHNLSSETSTPTLREEPYLETTPRENKKGYVSKLVNWWPTICPACRATKKYSPSIAEKVGSVSSHVAKVLDTEIKIPEKVKKVSNGLVDFLTKEMHSTAEVLLYGALTVAFTTMLLEHKDYDSFKRQTPQRIEQRVASLRRPIKELSSNQIASAFAKESLGSSFVRSLDSVLLEEVKKTREQKEVASLKSQFVYSPKESSFSENSAILLINSYLENPNLTYSSFSVAEDLNEYLEHSNKRNHSIVNSNGENDISINPATFGQAIVDSFTPFGKEISSFDSIGYSKENMNSRWDGVNGGLKKIVKGATLGFLDLDSKKEKTSVPLEILRSPHNIIYGVVESSTNTLDFGLGGVAAKTFNSVSRFGEGAVNSAVADTPNYAGAFVFSGLKQAEIFGTPFFNWWSEKCPACNTVKKCSPGTAELVSENFGNGKASQKSYEFVSLVPRFTANVINHEVAKNGEEISVYKDGKEIILSKGKIMPVLEQSSALALDTLAVLSASGVFNGSSGSGSTIHSNPSSGGISGGPGIGGSVGGGF